MIRLLIQELTERHFIPLTWLFVLIFANTVALIYFWRGLNHHAVAITIVLANLANVLIAVGSNYFLWTTTIDPGEHPRILAWNPKPWLAGVALYVSFAILAVLLGIAIWMVKSGRKRQPSLSATTADLLPVFIAILIAVITVRIPFVVQAAINAVP